MRSTHEIVPIAMYAIYPVQASIMGKREEIIEEPRHCFGKRDTKPQVHVTSRR
jgi:hypothetical protein